MFVVLLWVMLLLCRVCVDGVLLLVLVIALGAWRSGIVIPLTWLCVLIGKYRLMVLTWRRMLLVLRVRVGVSVLTLLIMMVCRCRCGFVLCVVRTVLRRLWFLVCLRMVVLLF